MDIIIVNYVKHAKKTLINVDTYCKKRSHVVTIHSMPTRYIAVHL